MAQAACTVLIKGRTEGFRGARARAERTLNMCMHMCMHMCMCM